MSDRVYLDLEVKVVSADRAQAFAVIREVRDNCQGAEPVVLARGTSGLLSGVDARALLSLAAMDAIRKLEHALTEAREYAKGML